MYAISFTRVISEFCLKKRCAKGEKQGLWARISLECGTSTCEFRTFLVPDGETESFWRWPWLHFSRCEESTSLSAIIHCCHPSVRVRILAHRSDFHLSMILHYCTLTLLVSGILDSSSSADERACNRADLPCTYIRVPKESEGSPFVLNSLKFTSSHVLLGNRQVSFPADYVSLPSYSGEKAAKA